MSVRTTVKALPTLFRVSFAEAVAYRAEMLVWILSTTLPLIMLALWSAVAREAPIGRYGQSEFTAYFLATFIVRQLTGSWAAWEMNFEIRSGTFSMRLLRPLPPVIAYAAENLAAIPQRLVIALPIAVISLWRAGNHFPSSGALWGVWVLSMVGAWLITFLANFAIGCLSFVIESSLKVMDIWITAFMLFSGYLMPIEVMPRLVQRTLDFLPFRYQIGLPVELMIGAADVPTALSLLARQWTWVAICAAVSVFAWRKGVKHFAAHGG